MNTLHSLRTSKKLGFILVALMLAIASVGSVGAISAPGQTAEANNATIQIPVGLPLEEWEQIFTLLPDTSISQQAYLKASNTEMGDYFGNSVAISGDTVVVGAHDEDSSATGVNGDETDNSAYNSGAAYVFTRMGHNWSQQAYLKASNTDTEVEDYFGYSVAISGDTIVVGAFREASNATGVDGDGNDNSASASGAAYVFTRSGDTWSQQAYLKASNTGADDYFGISVAISGDTIVVGAAGEASNATGVDGDGSDNSADFSGAAYVFTRSGSTWSQQAYLKASNTETLDNFGQSVAIDGDTIVVGAVEEDSNATGVNGDEYNNSANNSGAAYVFTRSGSTWSQQAYIKASNSEADDYFGYSVAVSGDTIVVGANGEASNATGVDGDGSDNSADYSGAAYVFTRSGSVWSQQAYMKASNTEAYDSFGFHVAISGDMIVVGSNEASYATGVNGDQDNNLAPDSGAAYLYTRSGSTWSQQAYLKASNTGAYDYFGWPVAISGNTIVAGAEREDSNATGVDGDQSDNSVSTAGAAYVFVQDQIMDADSDDYLSDVDCNDYKPSINPSAQEIHNGLDDDCDGWVDEGCQDPSQCANELGSCLLTVNPRNPVARCFAQFKLCSSGSIPKGACLTQCIMGKTSALQELCESIFLEGDPNRSTCLAQADSLDCPLVCSAIPSGGCGDSYIEPPEECDDNNNLDGDGCSSACIVELNQPPTADAGGPYFANEGDTVTLDASGSSDPDDGIVLYEWDLDNDSQYDGATGVTTTMSFDDDDFLTVSLRVTDSFGEFDTDTADITVSNVPPTIDSLIVADGEPFVLVGLDVNLESSFNDPGADTHSAVIDWDDGSEAFDPAVSPLNSSHVYQVAGEYTVSVTVTDDDDGVGVASTTITIAEPAEAAQETIDELDTLLTDPDLDPAAANAIEEALADLEGANDGQGNNGAIDKIEGGQLNAALVKVEQAIQELEAAEAADPTLDLSEVKEVLALTAKAVSLDAIEQAQAVASKPAHQRKIDQAIALVNEGDLLLGAEDYLGAVGKYEDALRRVQSLL